MKKLSPEAINSIKGALNILNKFKGDFSQELKDAVAVLAKFVAKPYPYPYPAKKSDEDLEKAGKKISKDTLKAIKKAIGILNGVLSKGDETKEAISVLSALLSEEEKKALKKADEAKEKDEKIDSVIKEATETKEKLEKDLGEKDKSISELTKRLETLEKAKGIKKQIEGQDEDDGEGEVKKSDKPWPSFDFELVEEEA
jgi:septal ring factor EnvC (AmiA/AmiB activator)